MGLKGFFFRGKSRSIPPNAVFQVTQLGRDKLQEFGGDPKSLILTALETRGTSDIEEISQASGVARGKVERYIPVLIRGGYIQYISSASGDSEE